MPVVRSNRGSRKKKSGGHGFFHDLIHAHPVHWGVGERTVTGFGKMAEQAPAGLYNLADALGQGARGHPQKLKAIGKGMVVGTKETYKHPLRDPAMTIMTTLGLVNPALRAGGLGRIGIAAGQDAANIAAASRGAQMMAATGMKEDAAIAAMAKSMKIPEATLRSSYHKLKPTFEKQVIAEQKQIAKGGMSPKLRARYEAQALRKAKGMTRGSWERELVYKPRAGDLKQWEKAGAVEPLPTKGADILKEATRLGIPTSAGGIHFRPHMDILKDIRQARGEPVVKVQVPASHVPTTRAAQAALDALTRKSPALARKRVKKAYARELDLTRRPKDTLSPGFGESLRLVYPNRKAIFDPKYNARMAAGTLRHPIKETNAAIRALRLFRPGYIPANAVGAHATELIRNPSKYGSTMAIERALRKKFPEAAKQIDRRQGETTSQAAAELGKYDPGKDYPITTLTHGIGTSLGKVVDRRSRARHFIAEFKRRHPEATADDIAKALDDPKRIPEMNRINDVAENSAIRFSKTPVLPGFHEPIVSKIDRALGANIFLYRWLTASTRYTGRVVKEHPTVVAALGQLANQAPPLSNVLPEYPSFMQGYVPAGNRIVGGHKLPQILNPQAASLWSMPPEVARDLKIASGGGERAVDVLHERLNPVQHGAAFVARGRDPFRQQTITEGRPGHKHPAPFSKKALREALRAELAGNPYSSLGRIGEPMSVRKKRLFPRSSTDIALQFLFGSFAVPSPVNPKIAKSMATKEKEPRGGGKRKRRKLGY